MGTCTYTSKKIGSLGNLRCMIGDVTLSSSYATGGDAATPGLFGLNEILYADIKGFPSGVELEYVIASAQANNTVKAWFPTGGAGAAPTTLANPTLVTGATAVTSNTATLPNFTGGIGVEVAATANLSTVTGRIILFGF